jgi:hypothetical protein
MPTFTKPSDDDVRLLAHTMRMHHLPLERAGVRVDLLVAEAKRDEGGDPVGPALKHRGRACLATVRIVPARDRVQGLADAVITIDGDRWVLLSKPEREAVLDHELTHLDLVTKAEEVQRDDGDRPKLKMRQHDVEFGWFVEVADRHGKHAQEVQQARALVVGEGGQILFAFLAEEHVRVAS